MFRKLLVWSLPLTLAAFSAFAQTTSQSKSVKEMQKQATQLNKEASQPQGQEMVLNSLSKQLNIPVATLQAEQKSTNFGPGELFIANSLAAASGKTFDQISQEFKSGKGWGEIANENNLKLGKVVSDLKRANKQVEKDQSAQAQANAGSSNAERGSNSRASGNANANANANSNANSNAGGMQSSAPRGGGQASPRGRR